MKRKKRRQQSPSKKLSRRSGSARSRKGKGIRRRRGTDLRRRLPTFPIYRAKAKRRAARPAKLPRRPYKVIGVQYRNKKTGKLVSKKYAKRYRHLVKGSKVYFSFTSNKRTSKKDLRKSYRTQALHELFPKIEDYGPLKGLLADYKAAGRSERIFIENRYGDLFQYLKDNHYFDKSGDVDIDTWGGDIE